MEGGRCEGRPERDSEHTYLMHVILVLKYWADNAAPSAPDAAVEAEGGVRRCNSTSSGLPHVRRLEAGSGFRLLGLRHLGAGQTYRLVVVTGDNACGCQAIQIWTYYSQLDAGGGGHARDSLSA